MKTEKARILIIDDDSEWGGARVLSLQASGVAAEWRDPQDVDEKVLRSAHLVLVDLNLGEFAQKTFPALNTPDGLAFSTLLRRQKLLTALGARPVGFALVSGNVADLAQPFPPTRRLPLLARQHNLEWIFPKGNLGAKSDGIASLAKAIRDIPRGWRNGIQNFRELREPLGLTGAKDIEACWTEVEKCHPPVYEVTQWTHGLAIIRWLLHTILHYPCFLWDEHYVAARLRMSHGGFVSALKKSARFRQLLAPSAYTGILHDFSGPRWWRHRVESIVWSLTKGDSQNTALIRTAVGKKAGIKVDPSTVDQPLVCRDADYNYIAETVAFENAVRVQPDDWPPYADAAWMRIEDLDDHAELRALVVQEDRGRLPKP